jgi:AcrR family transcriptional regulator
MIGSFKKITVTPTPAKLFASPKESARSEKVIERLLDAATQHFMEAGYEATSIGQIARFAHASKETFYRHFPTKEDLFKAVILRQVRGGTQKLTAVLSDEPPITALTAFGRLILDGLLHPENIALRRISLVERLRFPELGPVVHENGPARILAALAAYMDQQIAAGNLRKMNTKVGARQLLDLIVAEPLIRTVFGSEPIPNARQRRQRVDQAVDCFLNGYTPHD